MRFSLRALVVLFTLIAIGLGTREAVKLHHWHRNLPVEYHIGADDAAGFPDRIQVDFGRHHVEQINQQAAVDRQKLAEAIFADQMETAEFWVGQPKGDNLEPESNGPYGYGTRARRHLQPFESLYPFAYPKRVRDIVTEKNQTQFLIDPDIRNKRQARFLANWLASQDPEASKWLTAQLREPGQDDGNALLQFLATPKIILPDRNVIWLGSDKDFQAVVVDKIDFGSEPGDPALLLAKRLRLVSAASQIQLLLNASSTKVAQMAIGKSQNDEKDSEPNVEVNAELRRHLDLLEILATLRPDQETVLQIEAISKTVIELNRQNDFSCIRPGKSNLQRGLLGLANKLKHVLRLVCRSGDPRAKRDAIDLAYRWNAFNLYLQFAGLDQLSELERLFELRKSLCYKEFFVDFYAKTYGVFDDFRMQEYRRALPNRETGLEERLLVENLARAFVKLGAEIAKPKILQLVRERLEFAIQVSGELFEGTGHRELVELYLAECRDNGERAKKFEEFLHQRDRERKLLTSTKVEMDGCTFGPIIRRTQIVQMGLLSKQQCFLALHRIAPEIAKRWEYTGELQEDIAELVRLREKASMPSIGPLVLGSQTGNARLHNLPEFAQLMARHGLGVAPLSKDKLDQVPRLFLEVVKAFQKHGRYSFVPNELLNNAQAIDTFVIASNPLGFSPIAVQQEFSWSNGGCFLSVALKDRVHQVFMDGDSKVAVNEALPLPLCDILNHILERESISDRFVAVSSATGTHVLFGPPELFRQLTKRFGVNFPNADEYIGITVEKSK